MNVRLCSLVLSIVAACFNSVAGDEVKPFPQNRVVDFYANQARRLLDSNRPIPALLPEFPGLDGGSFGHWGQNPEADNFDYTLNDVDVGGTVAQLVTHFGSTTPKAICIRVGKKHPRTALFDPSRLTFTDIWSGDLVTWRPNRFGVTSGVVPAGAQLLNLHDDKWMLPNDVPTRFLGYFRNGPHVVFHYSIGEADIYDQVSMNGDKIERSMSIVGELPSAVELPELLRPSIDSGETKTLALGAAPRWVDQSVHTAGRLGQGDGPYVIDTLTVPYGKANPFGTPMRIGGFDFLPDGRIAVATLLGDVWLVDGVSDDLSELEWKRIAAGLHQPLGLVVHNGKILVLGRDQITRLHDLNGDDEVDYYECVTNSFPTGGGGNFATSLHRDDEGNLYWFTTSGKFGVTKLSKDGKPRPYSTGLRNSNGMGVSRDGSIVLATTQEGTWAPASAICDVDEGSYHGYGGPREDLEPHGYDMPLCFLPRGIDHCPGDLAFLPRDERFGPLSGSVIGTSFGYCSHYLVLREEIEACVQGGVVPLSGEFLSGAHRSRFNEQDGHFYVAGTDGWQSYAKENGSLDRVRYVGGELNLPNAIETHENGFLVRFNCELDSNSVRLQNVFCEQWNYLYSKAYGSAEYSTKEEGRRGHDYVDVRGIHLLDDRRSVFIEIPHLHPVMQFHLFMRLKTIAGSSFEPDVYYSIFEQRGPFTDLPNFKAVARRKRYPKFPIAESYPDDPRLLAQEKLGRTLSKLFPLELRAVPGLQFEPRRLRVPPNRQVALTLRNTDPSMPHNVVVVKPERLNSIGERAMLMAADPRAIAKHYVPDDDGVICLAPILNPDDQYTIYFNSPKKTGAYPFVCTFPGHWRVMQGTLYVLNEGEEFPTEPAQALSRQFVKMWRTTDLAAATETLAHRSPARGRLIFDAAGCIKCHVIGGRGTNLGPDLTKVSERFRGAKLLEQILEPSKEINKEHQAYVVLTKQGQTFTGLIVKKDANALHLLPNPLKPNDIVAMPNSEIDELLASPMSTMPKGLLMTFTEDEILDLLAYIQSGGQ